MSRASISAAVSALVVGWTATVNPAAAGTFKLLHRFKGGADGFFPLAGLVSFRGALYGTTTQGGGTGCGGLGCGTVFKIDPSTGAESVLYAFAGGNDGQQPSASLSVIGGNLYGTTFNGGSTSCNGNGCGTVFKIDPATGVETVLFALNGDNGAYTDAGLVKVGGALYGAAVYGGANRLGTIFKVDLKTGVGALVYSFKGGQGPGSDGAVPNASLINNKGTLFGTTTDGGANGAGAVFKINPLTGAEHVVYAFRGGTDGANPVDSLTSIGGALYGTTYYGGPDKSGIVFKVVPALGLERVIYSFPGNRDGDAPYANLINVGGLLYGTTHEGGHYAQGVLFTVNPSTGAEHAVHSFRVGNGYYAGLINVGGTLYGTTTQTAFSYTP